MAIVKESSSSFEDIGSVLVLTCERCGKNLTIIDNCIVPCPCGKKEKEEKK